MLPIGDETRGRQAVPVITYLLIALNIVVFLVELDSGIPFIRQWAVVPRRLLADPIDQFPTVITAMFMHAGWLHLLGNMLYLWIFGDDVEDRFGPLRFLGFYLGCGIAATFAQVAVAPNSAVPNLGASGAIAGVLSAYLVLFPDRRIMVLVGFLVVPLPALVVIGLWIVLQLVAGVGAIPETAQTGGVAYMAHIGGFLAGLLLTMYFQMRANGLRPSGRRTA
jgi:membrane associated rhomboid family serine protease